MRKALTCDLLSQLVHSIDLVQQCDVVRSGALRLCTPIEYLNGSKVDLFLIEEVATPHHYILSDFGQTALFLREMDISLFSGGRPKMVAAICDQYGVQEHGGVLQIKILPAASLSIAEPMLRLAQACARVSWLAAVARQRQSLTLNSQVRDALSDRGISYSRNFSAPGRFGPVRVDLFVRGRHPKYAMVLGGRKSQSVQKSATDAFTKLHDLKASEQSRDIERATVISSEQAATLKPTDKQRLEEYSTVWTFPDQESDLLDYLAA